MVAAKELLQVQDALLAQLIAAVLVEVAVPILVLALVEMAVLVLVLEDVAMGVLDSVLEHAILVGIKDV